MSDLPEGVEPHALADRFTCPGWDEPGACICGAVLPPMSEWRDAGRDWQHIVCASCLRGYVDEEEFIAIYEPEQWRSFEDDR